MGRDIVKNLKFKKHTGKHFDPELFAQLLDESYRNTKRADGEMTKKSFSPSSLGYGHGTCPRYWYMAFSGAMFIDDNDAVAVASRSESSSQNFGNNGPKGCQQRSNNRCFEVGLGLFPKRFTQEISLFRPI